MPELPGEPERARRHPAGHDRHGDAAPDRRPDRGDGPLAQDEVVADERAVEVERDQADRERRLRARRERLRGGRGRPAGRSASRTAVALTARPAGPAAARRGPSRRTLLQPGSTAATAAGASVPWSPPISSRATPSSARTSGRRRQERADDVEAVGAAVERRSRLERRGDRQPRDRVGADVGQVRGDDVEAARRRAGRSAAGRPRRSVTVSATAWPTAFSRARSSASGDQVGREDAHDVGHRHAPLPELDR